VALGRELTKLHETWYRGTPAQVRQQLGREDRGEMVLVLAGAAAKRLVTEVVQGLEGGVLPPWAIAFLAAAREGGMTLREAVKPLAKHLGVSASDLYKLAAEI
jgi:16S rRNA (cytidine1402-2'-O)-methyltransferase